MFTLEGTAKNKNSDARLFITLANADSGEIYYQTEHTLSVFRATKKKELTCNLPQPVSASENAHLQLKLKLINGDKTVLSFTSNEKQALVQSLTTIQTVIQILFIPSLTATIISCFIFILRCV